MKRFGEVVAVCLVGSATAVMMALAAWAIIKLLGGMIW